MNDDQHEAVIGRLDREREQAERRYVAALAALDAAAEPPASLVSSVANSEADAARVNQAWRQPARGQGWLERALVELSRFMPWRRRALDGAMIAALNRQAEVSRALLDAIRHFQSHVVWYGQSVAAFAATQRRGAGTAEGIEVVHAAINALATDWQVQWDTLQTREQRYDARVAALTKAYDDLRDVAALAQQSTLALKRRVEALATSPIPAAGAPAATPSSGASMPDPNAFTYVAFEDRYRGSPEAIQRQLRDYLPLFDGAANVLDVGCGRGELLQLFRERGTSARGIDVNDEMVAICRTRGLVADRADALEYLATQPESSLGGLTAIQVVEHLEPTQLMRVLDAAHRALKPGAPVVLETINAACWAAFFDSYIRDFTHVRPLHPDTLRYLVQASGFASADIQFRSPFAEQDRLPIVRFPLRPAKSDADVAMSELAEAVNVHAERLNARLFTHRDFAIIAKR